MTTLTSILWSTAVFLLAGFLAANYTLNHFYVNGGYMLDSGWFAYLSAHSTSWPASNPPSVGGIYFSTHFSPAFYICTGIYKSLSYLGFIEFDTIWFALTQGFWFGLSALSSFILLNNSADTTLPKNKVLIAIVSLVIAFNGISMAALGFPHFEIAIPALLIAFFAFYSKGYAKTAILFLCFGLLMREDCGLHYFGLFFLIASRYFLIDKSGDSTKKAKFFSLLAVFCMVYSLFAIGIQKIFFTTGYNALARVYLGEPAFAHISTEFIKGRIEFIAANRLYIFVPLILTLIISIARKDWSILIGVSAVLPWIVFSLLGISFQAGTLTSYYAFPVIIGLFWPVVSYSLFVQPNKTQTFPGSAVTRIMDASLIVLSSVVFFIGSTGNHDNSPWENFGPKWIGKINTSHSSLDLFIKSNNQLKFIMDDSAASLLNNHATPLQWKYQLGFSDKELGNVDAVLFQPGAWLTARVKELASRYGYSHLCYLTGSSFAILSRRTDVKNCYSPIIIPIDAEIQP